MYLFVFLFVLMLVAVFFHTYNLVQADHIDRKNIVSSELPKSFGEIRIFFITDICNSRINPITVQNVGEKIDIVIIGGNLLQKRGSFTRVQENINTLKKLGAPVYFIWGDRDYESDYHKLDANLLESDVKILANSAANFESIEGDMVSLMGFDNREHRTVEEDYAFNDAKAMFKILATHNADSFFSLKPEQQRCVQVVFSSCLTGYKSCVGLVEKDNTHVLISKGYKISPISSLFRGRGQCHVITIKPT